MKNRNSIDSIMRNFHIAKVNRKGYFVSKFIPLFLGFSYELVNQETM